MSEGIEIRRVQAYQGERSLTIVLPKVFSEKLRIEKGDFLKVHLENSGTKADSLSPESKDQSNMDLKECSNCKELYVENRELKEALEKSIQLITADNVSAILAHEPKVV